MTEHDLQPDSPILPPHIEETVRKIARLHADHRQGATGLQRAVEALTRQISRPRAAALLAALAVGWIAANGAIWASGRSAPDPPPFAYLGLAAGVLALLMTVFILITQRREDELSDLREQLTLELAIVTEQKSAKIIGLIEELRRDSPVVPDRFDPEAHILAKPADPEAVLDALKDGLGDAAEEIDG